MGYRFENENGITDIKSPRDLLRWKFGLHDETQPRTPSTGVPVPAMQNDGKVLRRATKDALTWIGHATYLVQLGGKTAIIDPVLSPGLGFGIVRNVAPGLSWDALPTIDVVLVTHNHRDHMDEPTLKKFGPEVTFVVPKGLGDWFRKRKLLRIVEIDWWQQAEVEGLSITFVPSQHWSRRGLRDINESLWGGYVIEAGGLRVYHSGDTAWFDGFADIARKVGLIDAAMLPIGAYAPRWFMYTQHMNPEDAVRAFQALGAREFIAMHWGTFKLTDEPLDEPPAFLVDAWRKASLPEEARHVLAIGETYLLGR